MTNLLFVFLLLHVYLSKSIDRLWLIRHCDKPHKSNNPCCSKIGYDRSNAWNFYFQHIFDNKNIIQIYASNFNDKKICMDNIEYSANRKCQKSQRMFLTAYYIHKNLKNVNINVFTINLNHDVKSVEVVRFVFMVEENQNVRNVVEVKFVSIINQNQLVKNVVEVLFANTIE